MTSDLFFTALLTCQDFYYRISISISSFMYYQQLLILCSLIYL